MKKIQDKVEKFNKDRDWGQVKEILEDYEENDGIAANEAAHFSEIFKDKKYCILIFLKNPQKIEPFTINKKGYNNMAAWITIKDIQEIKN